MSSIREIASLAGCSASTVSRALNNDPAVHVETREKVLAAANSAGYVAAVGRRITTNIGFVYAGRVTLESTYDSALLSGVVRGLDESKYDVLIINLQRDKTSDETYSQFFRRKGLRGVLMRVTSSTRRICREIANDGFPMISLSERFDDENISYIDCDSHQDSVRAVGYLIALGHRRIAFAMNMVPDQDHVDRLEGYQKALAEHDIPLDDKLILKQNANHAGGGSALKMLMSMPQPPTAVYFADPLLAVGATNMAHEAGIRIPEDIAIVGFDDGMIRHSVHPTMTAVCQDVAELGYQAAVELMRMIHGQAKKRVQKILPTFFEVNQSTGPPPETPHRFLPGGARTAAVPDTANVG